MSSNKPILAIIGATGVQGGSVVNHFLSLSPQPYQLRGITRNESSEASKALSERGVEMVAANLDDSASLVQAFEGAAAVFTVTDFWNPLFDPEQRKKAAAANKSVLEFNYEYELQQGKNLFHAAAKIATLDRFIFSSLSDASKWSGGKYQNVFHFTSKAHAAEYGKATYPELWKKTSILQVGFYLENMRPGAEPVTAIEKDVNGTVVFHPFIPKAPIPMVAAGEDTGPLVHALLQSEPGKNLIGVRRWMSMEEYVQVFSKVLGVEVRLSEDENAANRFPEEVRADIRDFLAYVAEFGYDAGTVDKTVVQPEDLGVPLKLGTVEEWIKQQDWSKVRQLNA